MELFYNWTSNVVCLVRVFCLNLGRIIFISHNIFSNKILYKEEFNEELAELVLCYNSAEYSKTSQFIKIPSFTVQFCYLKLEHKLKLVILYVKIQN